MKRIILMMAMTCIWLMGWAQESAKSDYVSDQITRQKVVENGGSGNYRAVVVTEKTFENYTIYRPRSVKAAARREGPLPLLVWCNGACSDNSKDYERMLNEIASHGYLVVAIGKMKVNDSDREDGGSSEQQVTEIINWVVQQASKKTSDYYKAVDVNNIALSGHSCGGAQAIANCANSRVKTLLIMNAGMGGMSMGGASPQTLNQLHCPIIYMTGGPDDVAYGNARTDFNNIKKVPVVWACMTSAGHGATYWDPRGGDFGRVAIKWMDWQLKGYSENASIFLKPDNVMFPKWNIQKRNFGDVDYENVYATPVTVGDPVFDRQAAEETFAFGADVSLLTQQTQSGKVFNNRFGQKKDVMSVLKEEGMNSVRVDVVVNPSDGVCNLTYARNLFRKANDQNMNVMLCLTYADSRGDMGSQQKPAGWKNHEMAALENAVKSHTSLAVRGLKGSNPNLKWVMVGYQLDDGMLWPDGRVSKGSTNLENFARLFNTAYDAVKAIDENIQVVLHVADLQTTTQMNTYLDKLKDAGVKWDVIGLSAYPSMSTMTRTAFLTRVTSLVTTLKERYQTPVMVVETGYYNDQPLEANAFLCDLLQQLIEAGAAGCFYWEPELTDSYRLGAWNPETRNVSIALEAFKGMKHTEVPYVMDIAWASDKTYFDSAPVELPVNARHIRDRIEKVDLMEGKQIYATSTEPPYTLRWTDPEPGLHNIFAQATATDGETASTDVVEIEVSADVTAINAVIAPNDIQLKANGNKVSIESGTPLRHIRIYSLNGMLLSEKKVNGTHRASLSVNAQQRNMLLLVQVETDAGTKTFHVSL